MERSTHPGYRISDVAVDIYRTGAYVRRWDCPICDNSVDGRPGDGVDASQRCPRCGSRMARALIAIPENANPAAEAPPIPHAVLMQAREAELDLSLPLIKYREVSDDGETRQVYQAREPAVPAVGWQVYLTGTGQRPPGDRFQVTGIRHVVDRRGIELPYYAVYLERST